MATPENLNKLDEFVKNTVQNYKVEYDSSHWDEFEKTLNQKPKSNTFAKWAFSLNTIIGIVTIGAASIIYCVIVNGNKNEIKNKTIQQDSNNTVGLKTNDKESINTIKVEDNNTSVDEKTSVDNTTHENVSSTTTSTIVTTSNNVNKSNTNVEKIKNDNITTTNNQNFPTPILGDMIDPKKGIVNQTKEDPALNKKALEELQSTMLYTKDANGNYVINPDTLKKIFDLIEQKNGGKTSVANDSIPK